MNTSPRLPGPPSELFALAHTELSLALRLGRLALLLALVVMTGVIGLLGLTAPSLPSGARVVFAVIMAIGLCGSVYGFSVLGKGRARLVWHDVIGGRVAVGFAAVVTLGALAIGLLRNISAAFVIAGFGVVLLGGSVALLRQANMRYAALTARRRQLAEQLKAGRFDTSTRQGVR